MFIGFPGHGMLINIDSIDHVRIETVRGAKSHDRLLTNLFFTLHKTMSILKMAIGASSSS